MGLRSSKKAEDNEPIYVNQSYDYNALSNSDPVSPQDEGNDKTKEDELKIQVEEHQEKDQVKKQEEGNDEEMEDEVEEQQREATNQVERPVPPQEQLRAHVEGMMLHQKQWRAHMEGMMLHQEQWRVHMEGLMLHQKIQTPTPASSGNPENSPAAPRGESTHKKPSGCAMCLLGVILIMGLVAIVLYIFCYFRDNERYLQFFGHMSYRPSLLLPPLIWLAALVKIKNGDHRNRHTSWDKLFECTEGICNTILNAITVDRSTIIAFFIYLLLPVGVCLVKIAYSCNTPYECYGIILIIWILSEIIGVLIFAFFFFLLYLRRLEVQTALKEASTIIRVNVGNFDECIIAIQRCFKQYYPLRSLMLLLLYILLFESIFGITVFLSWNYNEAVDQSNLGSNTTSALHWIDLDKICSFSCSAQDFIHLKRNIWYNIWIFLRHVMTILLPCWSASGIDMKYMWDDLTTDLYFLYSHEHESFWKKITVYVKGIHPETSTYSMLNIIVPVVALASGIFTGQQL